MSLTGMDCLDDLCHAPLKAAADAALARNVRVSFSLADAFSPACTMDPGVQTALELALLAAVRLARPGGEVRLVGAVDQGASCMLLTVSVDSTLSAIEDWTLARMRNALMTGAAGLVVEQDGSRRAMEISIDAILAPERRVERQHHTPLPAPESRWFVSSAA